MTKEKIKKPICKACNNRESYLKGYCQRCYNAQYYGYETLEQQLKKRNYIENGVGVLTNKSGKYKWYVDLESFEKCKDILWQERSGYAKNDVLGYLHRFLCPEYKIVDHIDRDKTNNRISNLREGILINGINKNLVVKSNTGYRGVHKSRNWYEACIHLGNKKYRKWGFKTPEEAYKQVLEIARSLGIEEYYKVKTEVKV